VECEEVQSAKWEVRGSRGGVVADDGGGGAATSGQELYNKFNKGRRQKAGGRQQAVRSTLSPPSAKRQVARSAPTSNKAQEAQDARRKMPSAKHQAPRPGAKARGERRGRARTGRGRGRGRGRGPPRASPWALGGWALGAGRGRRAEGEGGGRRRVAGEARGTRSCREPRGFSLGTPSTEASWWRRGGQAPRAGHAAQRAIC
jgi:hypothetical protein